MIFILVTLLVFHFDISGKDTKDEHPENKELKSVILSVFHSEILGKYFNDEHELNIPLISFTLPKSHSEISCGKDSNNSHPKNIFFILVALLVSKLKLEKDTNVEHHANIEL